MKRANVNLANHPFRNRKFFFLIAGALAVLICGVSSIAGYTYWKYGEKNRNFSTARIQTEKMLRDVQREERRLDAQIENASQKYKKRIDLMNTLIFKKSFSWLDFLSALEDALPESCYVVSMSPSLKENSKMEVRLKVASPNLDELLKLNKNLYEKRFSNIRIISESRNEAGMLISEISLVYERTV